jgi:hypothetical protein
MSPVRAPALERSHVSGFFARVEMQAAPTATVVVAASRDGRAPRIGGRTIEPGAYLVRLDETRERIVLESERRTHALAAFLQRASVPVHAPIEAHVVDDGGARARLIVRLQSGAEWVA